MTWTLLGGLDVLPRLVDALDEDLVVVLEDADHPAPPALVGAGDDLDGVASLDLGSHGSCRR